MITRRALLHASLALTACATTSSSKPRARGPVVIVPGTGAGKWAYEKLAAALERRGRRAIPLTLPVMGERIAELKPEIDVNTHARDVAAQLEALDAREVTLVGHSYGGMVIAGAAGERVRSLVFLDAYVPKPGESLLEQDPGFASFIAERVKKDGEGWKIPPFPGDQFLTAPADIKFFDEHVTACPFAMYQAGVHVDEDAFARAHKGYVSCGQYQYFIALGERKAAEGWPLRHLPYGHLSCVTNPDETADAIVAVEGP